MSSARCLSRNENTISPPAETTFPETTQESLVLLFHREPGWQTLHEPARNRRSLPQQGKRSLSASYHSRNQQSHSVSFLSISTIFPGIAKHTMYPLFPMPLGYPPKITLVTHMMSIPQMKTKRVAMYFFISSSFLISGTRSVAAM